MRVLPFILMLFVAMTPVTAQDGPVRKSDIIRLLAELPNFSPSSAELESLGFQGEKLEMAKSQIARMLRDPVIADNIATRVLAANNSTIDPAGASGLFWPLIDQGLGHLSVGEMRYYYRVEQAILKAMPMQQCGLMIKEKLSPKRLSQATARVASRLDVPVLKEYYRIQFKAARAGATRKAARLSAGDEALVVEKINAALGQELATRDDARRLSRVYGNLDRASNRWACMAGRVFMDAVLSMKGRDLHHALTLLSSP